MIARPYRGYLLAGWQLLAMAGVVALMGFVDSMFLYLAVLSVPDHNAEFGRLMSHPHPMWRNDDGRRAVFFGMEQVRCVPHKSVRTSSTVRLTVSANRPVH